MSETSRRFSTLVSTLGGESLNPEDIEWALDIPAGKQLLHWLAAQLSENENGASSSMDSQRRAATLHPIALTAEELSILELIRVHPVASGENSERIGNAESTVPKILPPKDYLPPSRLRAHGEFLNAETRLAERETKMLTARLEQAKLASQHLLQSMETIRSALERIDHETRITHERITDLSLEADTAIASAVKSAEDLIQIQLTKHETDRIQSLSESLINLNSLRSELIKQVEELFTSPASEVTDRTPAKRHKATSIRNQHILALELQADAIRIQNALDRIVWEDLEDTATRMELGILCSQLEAGEDIDLDFQEQTNPTTPVDVVKELSHAWALDCAEALDAEGAILDSTLAALQQLLPPLNQVHSIMLERSVHSCETEALLGALGEEIESILDDLDKGKAAAEAYEEGIQTSSVGQRGQALEQELVKLLKTLEGSRSSDGPPLVLLDSTDLINELKALVQRSKDLEEKEKLWASPMHGDLLTALEDLNDSHSALLSSTYAYSQMNTSGPYLAPPDVRTLETSTVDKAKKLEVLAGQLQSEVVATLDRARTQRRLGVFVDKWAKT